MAGPRQGFGEEFMSASDPRQAEAILEGEPGMMGMFPIAKHPTILLFDSGASHSFINRTFVNNHTILIREIPEDFHIHSPRGRMCTKEMVYNVPIVLGGHTFPTTMIVLKDQDIDVILGMNWLNQRGAIIDAFNRTIKVNIPNSNS